MRNSDGGIWRLRWERTGDRYAGFVVNHPSVSAEAGTFHEMEKLLIERIDNELHAGEWTAEWDPPPPLVAGSPGRTLKSHVSLAWEGRYVALQEPGEVYTSLCPDCAFPTGPRTAKPLRVGIEISGNLCGDFGSIPRGPELFSTELADALVGLAGSGPDPAVAFRPVVRLGRGRKAYVEPVCKPQAALAPTVSLKGYDPGSRCAACGFTYRYMDIYTHGVQSFHRAADLPVHLPLFWIADLSGKPEVCVSADWWRTARREKFANGVVSRPIGVVDHGVIDTSPTFKDVRSGGQLAVMRKRWLVKQEYFATGARIPFEPWTP